jgi:hypothetical protein
MPFDLSSCLAKTSRAREHIAELRRSRSELANDNILRGEVERNGRDIVGRLRILGPIPSRVACVVGDAVHNLRAALDHLACVAVQSNRGTVTRDTQFPITFSAEQFRRNTTRQLLGASDAFVQFAESRQPYHTDPPEFNPLHIVNRLDIKDKHRQLVVAAILPIQVAIIVKDRASIEPPKMRPQLTFPLIEGLELTRFKMAVGHESSWPDVQLELNADVALVEESPVHAAPLVNLLENFLHEIEALLHDAGQRA